MTIWKTLNRERKVYGEIVFGCSKFLTHGGSLFYTDGVSVIAEDVRLSKRVACMKHTMCSSLIGSHNLKFTSCGDELICDLFRGM